MELVSWEINASLIKGLLFGIEEKTYSEEDVFEHDYDLNLLMIRFTLTLVYN